MEDYCRGLVISTPEDKTFSARLLLRKMLEQFLIFTRGGLILWICSEFGEALKGSPIDDFINKCLLEERSGGSMYRYGSRHSLKWTFNNELGLVFVAVYQEILRLLYVDYLLAMVNREFSEIYDPKRMDYSDFGEMYRQLRKEAEAKAEELRKVKKVVGIVSNGVKQGQVLNTGLDGGSKSNGGGGFGAEGEDGENTDDTKLENQLANCIERTSSGIGAFDVSKLQKLRSKGVKKTYTVTYKGPKVVSKKQEAKKNREWHDSPREEKLDFTDHTDGNGDEKVEIVAAEQGESMMDKEEVISSESECEEGDDDDVGKDSKAEAKNGWLSSMFLRF